MTKAESHGSAAGRDVKREPAALSRAVYRLAMSVRLLRDSALAEWRPIAKDGFTLPSSRAVLRPSVADVMPGETADFEFTPDRRGDLVLLLGPANREPEAKVQLRVSGPR